ncbi:MAG: caspase family protein [Gallionella sp.]|nr:caspase family protein [Gallionella sp.]
MNIAILIGISEYKLEAALPACAFDAENMRQLLVASKKYDDIQCINHKTDAAQVKDELRAFFAKYQNSSDISEALIYFSGHGVYQNDALLCCSDFNAARPSTTSISNTELDDLLRSVKPEVAVKIIDACQSGSPYIKDASAGFEKALGASKLKSFICMASSRQDQLSYASKTESAFTSKWINAALSKLDGTVFYRDIQAALADAFVSNPDQTPHFVNQGTGLEVFSTVTAEMKSLNVARAKSVLPEKPDDAVAQLIEQEVAKIDKKFVPQESVIDAIGQGKVGLNAYSITEPIVKKFYSKELTTDIKLSAIPKARAVADFAAEQAWPKRYFVKIITENYQARVLKDPLGSLSLSTRLFAKRDDSDYVNETKTRPAHLEATETLPFEVAEISYTSSHPSLAVFQIYIGIVHALTEVMILSATVRLAQRGWSQRTPELSEVQWRYESYAWADVVRDPEIIWKASLVRGEADIRAYLESLIPKNDAPVEEAGAKQD